MSGDRKIFSVTELTRLIRATLEDSVGAVWLEGEISNLRQPSSGHCYFTVKDAGAQIRAVLFRQQRARVRVAIQDGLQVRLFGDLSVYEKSGEYQVIVRAMEEAGRGALQARFEALKEQLQKEGLFDAGRKRPLPTLPRHVGVVTSPTGAAIRDILNIVTRRFPNLHVVLAPVKVQGDGAAQEIAEAIARFNRMGGIDVLIVGRGGGSLEDLWAFNEEIVARAIVASAIPVISAVGHEIDFTISDFVADLRAPTPSAAAELVVGRKEDFEREIGERGRRLGRALRESLRAIRNRLRHAEGSYVFREPLHRVRQGQQRLDGLVVRMRHGIIGAAGEGRRRLATTGVTLRHGLDMRRLAATQDLKRVEQQLRALNPLAVLDRGYSLTRDDRGKVVRSAAGLRPGQRVTTRLAEGRFESEVTRTHDDQEERPGG